ncbi:MAG: gamma carbonic anhydrase family protein [Pseudomonadota bacterium]
MTPLIFSIGGKHPVIHDTAWIAPGAVVCGDVEIGPEASIWYGCVLRADTNRIRVGARANVQDGTVIHCDAPEQNGAPTIIGENALVGHKCLLHGATVDDGGFVGMDATLLERARVETGAMLAAGAFLTNGKVVPTGELWAGRPAKKFRDLKNAEEGLALMAAAHYVAEAKTHRTALAE